MGVCYNDDLFCVYAFLICALNGILIEHSIRRMNKNKTNLILTQSGLITIFFCYFFLISIVSRRALENAIRSVQENQVGLKLNAKRHVLVCAHDVNLLGDNINNRNKNTEVQMGDSKKVDL
jgi:hypothetical protein